MAGILAKSLSQDIDEDFVPPRFIDENGFEMVTKSDIETGRFSSILSENLDELYNEKTIQQLILRLDKDLKEWTKLRRRTISKLRGIAEYIGKSNYSEMIIIAKSETEIMTINLEESYKIFL